MTSGPDSIAGAAASGTVSINVPKASLDSAGGVGSSPNPAIGSSMNYVQGMQGESRTQSFSHGAQEGKGGGGILGKVKGLFGGGGASEDAAASGGAEAAGAGIAEDAAIVAV